MPLRSASLPHRSYAWRYPLRLVSGALNEWCSAKQLDPKRQYVWIDVLCWNQHGRLADPVVEWTLRVEAIGHQLTMLHPWNSPVYTTRAWVRMCRAVPLLVRPNPNEATPHSGHVVMRRAGPIARTTVSPVILLSLFLLRARTQCVFELWHAIRLGAACNLGIILAPEDRVAFHAAINRGGYGVVDEALEQVHAESAEAFSAVDLARIHAKVKSTPGGFDTLNEVVKQRLRQWFESQGGIKVATNRGDAATLIVRPNSRDSIAKTDTVRQMSMIQLSDGEQYQSYDDIRVGDRVTVSRYQGAGVVRFVGVINTERTHGKARVGVELDVPKGKHNGTVGGHQYFKCAAKHGLLVPRGRVSLLAHGEAARDGDLSVRPDSAGNQAPHDQADQHLGVGGPGRSDDRDDPGDFGFGAVQRRGEVNGATGLGGFGFDGGDYDI